MNPVDQRSEFCRPETAKSVDQRTTAGNSVPAGFFGILEFRWGIFAENFAENFENPAGTEPPPRRSPIYRFRGLCSTEIRSLVYRIQFILRECSL